MLVVTPAGLVGQWQEELERKFALPTTVAARGGWEATDDRPVVLASLAAARRDPLKAALAGQHWELVIVDEAHRLRNPANASGRLGRDLRARYLLLLTATPVENRLQDLYELVNLVAPGLLGTAAEFRRNHGNAGAGVDALRNVAALRVRTREILVRHRRSEVAVLLPQRLAETVLVTPGDDEHALYTDLTARIRAEGRDAPPSRRLTLRSLARLAGSSPAALSPTLDKIGWDDLARRARAIERPARPTSCWPGCARTPSAARRSWCSPRSGTPSTRCPGRWPPRGSRRPATTAACPGGTRMRPWPRSATRFRCCCPPSRPGRGGTCSSVT